MPVSVTTALPVVRVNGRAAWHHIGYSSVNHAKALHRTKGSFLATHQPSTDCRLRKPQSSNQRGISDVWVTLAMVVVFGAFLFFFRVPHHYAQPPLQANVIADLSDRIVFVGERADGGSTLEIVIDHPPTYMANILADLGQSAVVITRGLQQHFPDLKAQKVRFVVQRHARGIEGVALQDRVVAIEFDRALLMRQQLNDDYPFQELLNLSSNFILGTPEDEVVVRAFCANQIAAPAAVFCNRQAR
ncbi:hypothetical protein ACSFA0_26175 [Variovorax sp. LT1P1]|uniref:hypothetical protein n=1 Tax=Variovorax sp. LT1P1 TaxID=3443730 RepID=UPI003F45F70E